MKEIFNENVSPTVPLDRLEGRELVAFIVKDSQKPKFLVRVSASKWGFISLDHPGSEPTFVADSFFASARLALAGGRRLFTFDNFHEAAALLPKIAKMPYVKIKAEEASQMHDWESMPIKHTAAVDLTFPARLDYAGSGEPLPTPHNMEVLADTLFRLATGRGLRRADKLGALTAPEPPQMPEITQRVMPGDIPEESYDTYTFPLSVFLKMIDNEVEHGQVHGPRGMTYEQCKKFQSVLFGQRKPITVHFL